jgi:hypothetical protein
MLAAQLWLSRDIWYRERLIDDVEYFCEDVADDFILI